MGEEEGYILIKDNKIMEIGFGVAPPASQSYDLHGAEVFPGFCDTHTHLSNIALMHDTLDLTGKTREEVLKLLSKKCKEKNIVVGRGWDESFWSRKEYITREELDIACPDKIVLLIREDGHVGVVNSFVMKKFSLSNDGILREGELEKMINHLHLFKDLNLEYAQNYALSKGITCVHDFADANTMRMYFAIHSKNLLKIRVYANFYQDSYVHFKNSGVYSGFGDSALRIGALKIFADGSIGAETSATEYKDGKKVAPILHANKIREIVKDANSHGIRVFTHAIGDFAIEEVVKGYAGTTGNRIEHFELVPEHILESKSQLEVSMQPNFLKWAKRGGLYHRKLGAHWLENNNPYRKIIDSGISLLFGSDCMPLDPLFGINLATNSEFINQRITREEAMLRYTIGSKYMNHKLGRVKRGYIADLVAVDFKSNAVILTIVDGVILYSNTSLMNENL